MNLIVGIENFNKDSTNMKRIFTNFQIVHLEKPVSTDKDYRNLNDDDISMEDEIQIT